MVNHEKRLSAKRMILVLAAILVIAFCVASGSFLVKDKPGPADIIVVLAGETEVRPAKGLELLKHGYASQMILDVPKAQIYGHSEIEIARQYAQDFPESAAITICPILGLSTKTEVKDVQSCLNGRNVHRILLVTSDFHTRRALSIFSRQCHGFSFSIAAAYDARKFGTHWWRHREWAKTNLNEWMRLVWWDLIERWM